MKSPKFSDQQVAFILRQAEEGTRGEEVCPKAGISQQKYYRWCRKNGGFVCRSDVFKPSCERVWIQAAIAAARLESGGCRRFARTVLYARQVEHPGSRPSL